MTSHWSDVEPGEPGWWWVYCLGSTEGEAIREPLYVGMTKHLRRRLVEHARFWTDVGGHAYVIAMDDAEAARRLEGVLIGVLRPRGNEVIPHGSWLERRYLLHLHRGWCDGSIQTCGSCGCLHHRDRMDLPLTQSDPACINHRASEPYRDSDDYAEDLIRYLPEVFPLPGLWRPEVCPSEDVLEQVSPEVVSPTEEGNGRDAIYEPFIDGP